MLPSAAVLDILLAKTKKALERYPVKTLVVAGASQLIRAYERLAEEIIEMMWLFRLCVFVVIMLV
ncbi:MAG: hypothetical protein ACLTKL_06175 [Streptococcus salivarius]